MLVRIRKTFLVISWLYIFLIGENPYLEKFYRFVRVLIFFSMLDTGSGTHHLYITLPDDLFITHVIKMFQVSAGWDGNYFHVFMRMGAKAHSPGDGIIIQNS